MLCYMERIFPIPLTALSVNCFLCTTEAFSFHELTLVDCWSYFLDFQSPTQKGLTWATSWSGPTSLSFHSFRSNIEIFDPFGIGLCEGWEREKKFHSSTHRYPVFPIRLLRCCLFSTLCFSIFIKNWVAVGAQTIAGSSFVSIISDFYVLVACWFFIYLF